MSTDLSCTTLLTPLKLAAQHNTILNYTQSEDKKVKDLNMIFHICTILLF